MEFIQQYLPHLQNLGIGGYWLLLLVAFGESFVLTGIFVPGTVILIIMGGLVPHGYYDFGDLMFFAVTGSIFGDAASYEMGRVGRLHAENFRFVQKYFTFAKNFFRRHGAKSVVMGRFIGPIRSIIPFIAGVMDMKRGQFYMYNIASAIGWSASYLALGYVCGYAWKKALLWSSLGIGGVIGLFVIGFALYSLWRWYYPHKLRTIDVL